MIEAILEGKREAPAAAEPPPGASHAPAEPSVPLRALSGSAVARLGQARANPAQASCDA